MTEVTDRLAVVTGGGTGIGRAIASTLVGRGDTVMLIGRRPGPLSETATKLNAGAGADRVRWHSADLTDPAQVAAAAETIRLLDRPVDVLVNNAGGRHQGEIRDLAEVAEHWCQDYRINVLPTVLLTEALKPWFRRPGGRVVGLGSVAAFRPTGSYGAAKAALHTWMNTLATELAPDGITVNLVAPGFVPDTEFFGATRRPAGRPSRRSPRQSRRTAARRPRSTAR